ncbi:MAG: hypothetical protein KAX38_03145, partial [Candidatus Krumholzibacteria bacterium]|nr:hypothetical protein [Candidatus Krumholzibacteria bacterium]
VRGVRSSGTKWLSRLTPPERETLYRYREFLVLPDRPPTRVSMRISEDRIGSSGLERSDAFISILGDRWKVISRARASVYGRPASFYISSEAMSGRFRLHGGDFLPDFSMGLLFCAYVFSYPFTGGYPFRGYRWLVGRTSFYGRSIRGLAGEVWLGRARAIFFTGSPRYYRSGSFHLEGERVCGGRIEFGAVGGEAGFTVSGDPSSAGGRLLGVDARWRIGKMVLGCEVACDGRARIAGTWGMSLRGKVFDAGILLHGCPYRLGNRFGCTAGRGASAPSRRGIGVVLRRRIPRRIEIRASLERSSSRAGFDLQKRDLKRVEIVKKWKGGSIKLSFRLKNRESFENVPCPGGESMTFSTSKNLNLLYVWRLRRDLRLRTSLGCPWGKDYVGVLLSPSLGVSLFSGRIMVSAACSIFRSLEGKAIFHFYEPSLKGSYPWSTVSGDGCRTVLLVNSSFGAFGLSGRIVADSTRGLEARVQLALVL